MAKSRTATSVLSVRVDPAERALLERAAEQSRTTVSDFMRRKAIDAAEFDLLNRTTVTIPAKDWQAFEAWAARSAETIPALTALSRRRPTWER
jgi:uncharacterized protein (DUF1778 family)